MRDLDLSRRHLAQLAAHNALSYLGIDRLRPVRITPARLEGGQKAFYLEIDGQRILTPAALIWRSYRRGFADRSARLAADFGLGKPFNVSPGEIVIDVGANVGDFSLAAAGCGARVFAFDGDPAVCVCLRENVSNIPEVTVANAILWKADEVVTFYSAPDRADSSLFLPPGKSIAASFRAVAQRLDGIADRHGIGQVALLKIDAEGAEPEVLMGATELLARTRAVAIDTGPERNGEETHVACCEILTECGFDILPRPDEANRKITMARRTD